MRRGARAAPLLLAALLSACPSPTPQPTATASGTPGARGELIVAYPYEPATLDPFSAAGDSIPTRDLARMLMPALDRAGPGGVRTPWLLADEPVVSRGPPFSVALTLRDDAVWSDGTAITVEDLRATHRLAVRRGTPGYDRIARVVAESPKRARIEFARPFARWRSLFNEGLGVVPAHVISSGSDALHRRWPVSGGPFVLRRWRRGLDMTFAPNPRAWAGAPRVRALRVVFVPDATGARELFKRGEVDVLGPYHAPDWQRRAGEVRGATVSTDTGSTWASIVFNTRAPPVRAPSVRRAFVDAIDRALIVRGLVQAEGTLLIAGGYGVPGRRLARARRELRGRAPTFTMAIVAEDDLAFGVAEAIKFQAADAGFSFEEVPLEPDRFYGPWLHGPDFEAAFLIRRGARPSVGDVPLYRVAVSLVSSAAVSGVVSSAGPDGPFWGAQDWAISR